MQNSRSLKEAFDYFACCFDERISDGEEVYTFWKHSQRNTTTEPSKVKSQVRYNKCKTSERSIYIVTVLLLRFNILKGNFSGDWIGSRWVRQTAA